MEFKELRNFVRVARAGSVSRAAEDLRLAQPALSRQISKLENELGVSLFARHGRGVRLTAAGSLLLERAEAISHLVHQTTEEIKDERAPTGGRIVIGIPPGAGRLLVAPFVKRLQADRPQALLQIREGVTSALQDWLLEKRVDVAVLHNPPPLEALKISPVLTERMFVIGPPSQRGHDGKGKPSYRIRDLADLPLILPSLAHNNRRLVEQAALDQGVRLRIRIEVDSVAFAKAMVENGLGYTILTFVAVQEEVARHQLTACPIVRPSLSTKVSIVTLKDKQLPELTQAASQMLHDVVRDLVRSKRWTGRISARSDARRGRARKRCRRSAVAMPKRYCS